MRESFFAGPDSRLRLSFIWDAHSGFRIFSGVFFERASDVRHWKSLRLWPVDSTATKSQSGVRSTRMRLFDRAANNRIDRHMTSRAPRPGRIGVGIRTPNGSRQR